MATMDTEGAGEPSTDSRGAQVSPELREKLLLQLRAIFAEVEVYYPEFLAESRRLLPVEAKSPRFGFIVRRLWMRWSGDLPDDWRQTLAGDFHAFEASFNWSLPAGAEEDPDFVAETLSVWQRRHPQGIGTTAAVEFIRNTVALRLKP